MQYRSKNSKFISSIHVLVGMLLGNLIHAQERGIDPFDEKYCPSEQLRMWHQESIDREPRTYVLDQSIRKQLEIHYHVVRTMGTHYALLMPQQQREVLVSFETEKGKWAGKYSRFVQRIKEAQSEKMIQNELSRLAPIVEKSWENLGGDLQNRIVTLQEKSFDGKVRGRKKHHKEKKEEISISKIRDRNRKRVQLFYREKNGAMVGLLQEAVMSLMHHNKQHQDARKESRDIKKERANFVAVESIASELEIPEWGDPEADRRAIELCGYEDLRLLGIEQ